SANPVGRIATHLYGSTSHISPEMHADAADDGDTSAGHAATDPLDLAQLAAKFQLVAAGPFDVEKVFEVESALAVKYGKCPHRVDAEPRERVRGNRLGFERDRREFPEGESDHALGSTTCSPCTRSASTG